MTSVPVKKALNALLRDPGNLNCADCKTQQHPRWAAWSLGVFICIKCAGIHRSLGTHISKVKSVDLDTWKEEHLGELIKWGNNVNANEYYENKLNQDVESQRKLEKMLMDTNKLSSFIRNKYEYKKWCGDSPVIRETPIPKQKQQSTSNVDLLLNSNDTTTTTSTTTPLTKTKSVNVESPQLLHLNKIGTQSQPNMTNNNTAVNSDRPDLKRSILSLYSKPNSNSNPMLNNTMNSRNNSNNSSTPSMSNSPFPNLQMNNLQMNNLQMNNTTISNSNTPPNNSTISLDDNELFKNVWQ